MQRLWIVAIFSILASVGLLTVILGQCQVMDMLKAKTEKMKADLPGLYTQHEKESQSQVLLEKQVAQMQKEAKEMEASITRLIPEIDIRRRTYDTCQHEVEKLKDDLAETETRAALKAESDAWNQEFKSLIEQLRGYRPACDYVKEDSLAAKLCGDKPS